MGNTRKLSLPIPNQAQSCQSFSRDQQRPNHNLVMTQSSFVTAKTMKPVQKDINRSHRYKAVGNNFTRIINDNGESDFGETVEFVDIDLSFNKLSL